MKKLILLFSAILLLSSCERKAQEVTQSGDFQLEFLFEKDGCKMYRFRDGGRNIYWANCSGKINADYTQSSGKSNHTERRESITTE